MCALSRAPIRNDKAGRPRIPRAPLANPAFREYMLLAMSVLPERFSNRKISIFVEPARFVQMEINVKFDHGNRATMVEEFAGGVRVL